MRYIWQQLESGDVDEPTAVYRELDGAFRETRRVEVYPDGQMYACGGIRGNEEALSADPFPEDLRTWEGEVQPIPGGIFQEVWAAAQERPDGLMGLFL